MIQLESLYLHFQTVHECKIDQLFPILYQGQEQIRTGNLNWM